jgi:hypothetical protein
MKNLPAEPAAFLQVFKLQLKALKLNFASRRGFGLQQPLQMLISFRSSNLSCALIAALAAAGL